MSRCVSFLWQCRKVFTTWMHIRIVEQKIRAYDHLINFTIKTILMAYSTWSLYTDKRL